MVHTKDKLAEELRKIGLDDMAEKAAAGYYDDFLSPLTTPCVQLVSDLQRHGGACGLDLAKRAMEGEFDATEEEADAWANSPEGRETLGTFLDDIRRKK